MTLVNHPFLPFTMRYFPLLVLNGTYSYWIFVLICFPDPMEAFGFLEGPKTVGSLIFFTEHQLPLTRGRRGRRAPEAGKVRHLTGADPAGVRNGTIGENRTNDDLYIYI